MESLLWRSGKELLQVGEKVAVRGRRDWDYLLRDNSDFFLLYKVISLLFLRV